MSTTTRTPAGVLTNGHPVNCFTIANDHLEVSLLDFGVRATGIRLAGSSWNLILDYPSVTDYEHDQTSMGAVVGRFANRIRAGRFDLEGRPIQLSINRGTYHLHGGTVGFACRQWRGEPIADGVRFALRSPDGEEGYPGNLDVTLTVRLSEDVLEYHYRATTDRNTIINLTNHSYFNLDGSADILGHRLQLLADHYLPIDGESLPTGEILSVADSPFDFRETKTLGRDIERPHPQLRLGSGYDHCYVLNDEPEDGKPVLAARLSSGRVRMTIYTTEPGVQVYSGNYLPSARHGVCLETQHFPDSPNQPQFPSTHLRAGETYSSITRYQFEAIR